MPGNELLNMTNNQVAQVNEGNVSFMYVLVNGIRIPAWVADPNVAEDLERFQARKDDVFITSYPKSGMSPKL